MSEREVGKTASEVEALREKMMPSLRHQLQRLASQNVYRGRLVVPSLGWKALDPSVDKSQCSPLEIDEDKAVKALGFLLRVSYCHYSFLQSVMNGPHDRLRRTRMRYSEL